MNCLLLLAIVAAVAIAQSSAMVPDPKIQEILTSCQKESKVSDQELQAYLKNPMDAAIATNSLKCSIKCGMEKLGTLKNGQPVEEGVTGLYAKLPEQKLKLEDVKKLFATCKSEKGADDCDTAYKLLICFRKGGIILQ